MGNITRTFANSISASGVTAVAPGTVAPEDTTTGTLGIPAVAGDPPSPSFGDIWLNTTAKKFKTYLLGSASWATGTSMPYGFTGGAHGGPFNAIYHVSGYGSHPKVGGENGARGYDHLFWNGTSWAIQTDFPYPNSGCFGQGTQDDHMCGGGHGVTGPNQTTPFASYGGTVNTYKWSGSPASWSSGPSMPVARSTIAGAGKGASTSDFMIAGGWTLAGQPQTDVLFYNGTSFSVSPVSMPTGRYPVLGQGASTSDVYNIGWTGPGSTTTTYWNGTSWASGPSLNSQVEMSSETLTYNASDGNAIAVLPADPGPSPTQLWNGTAWGTDTACPLAGVNQVAGGAGTSGASYGMAFGGGNPPYPASAVSVYTGAGNVKHASPATFAIE
jgi:hypothetical protein